MTLGEAPQPRAHQVVRGAREDGLQEITIKPTQSEHRHENQIPFDITRSPLRSAPIHASEPTCMAHIISHCSFLITPGFIRGFIFMQLEMNDVSEVKLTCRALSSWMDSYAETRRTRKDTDFSTACRLLGLPCSPCCTSQIEAAPETLTAWLSE